MGKAATGSTMFETQISSEEARKGHIAIPEDQLDAFPPVGESFPLEHGGKYHTVQVKQQKPNAGGQSFIRWPGLKAGDEVRIEKTNGTYELTVHRA
jgi:hypothetical protein